MYIILHPLSLMHHPSCLKLAIALQYGMGVKGGRMRDGRWDVVPPLSLLSWTSRHAQSSSDLDRLFVWGTEDSQGSHLFR